MKSDEQPEENRPGSSNNGEHDGYTLPEGIGLPEQTQHDRAVDAALDILSKCDTFVVAGRIRTDDSGAWMVRVAASDTLHIEALSQHISKVSAQWNGFIE